MKKINKTWYAVIDAQRTKLVRVTDVLSNAISSNSVLTGSTVHTCYAKTVKQAIRIICADVSVRASEGCFADHGIHYDE